MRNIVLIATTAFSLVGALPAQESTSVLAGSVMSSPQRMAALRTAEQVTARKATTWKAGLEGIADPFFRPDLGSGAALSASNASPGTTSLKAAEEVLNSIGTKVAPTGTMLIGSEPFLLISGRRYRVGDEIPVTIDGLVYNVAISSIERNSYTLRLNDKELRREFK